MTGYSWSKPYWHKMVSCLLVVSGSFLILEHMYHFGGVDIELLGHEWLGLAMIILAFLLSMKYEQIPVFLEAIKNRAWLKIFDEGER